MNIFGIIALGIIGTLLSITLKSHRPEFGILAGIATGILIMLSVAEGMVNVADELQKIVSKTGLDTAYFKITLKVIGISYITQFGVEVCRDAGENAIASKVDAAGKICVMILTIPVISGFLNMIISMLNSL